MSSPGGQNNSGNLQKPGRVRHLAEYFDRIGKGTPTKLPNLTKTKGGSITKKRRPGIKKPNESTRRKLSESMRNFLAREKSEDQEEKSTDKQKFNLDSSRPPD